MQIGQRLLPLLLSRRVSRVESHPSDADADRLRVDSVVCRSRSVAARRNHRANFANKR